MTDRTVSTEAPAKINLFLRVLDRRPDGYHELRTVFQSVSFADQLSVTLTEADGGIDGELGRASDPNGKVPRRGEISLRVEGAELGPTEENLAWRAAVAFRSAVNVEGRIRIDLCKNIPAGAGLGGGSSDAAAVLRCLSALVGFSDSATLHRLATDLGSDVPFFLSGPVAHGAGRGDELTALPPLPERALVIALPPVHVSTVEAYRAISESRTPAKAGAVGPPSMSVEAAGRSRAQPRDVEASSLTNFDWDTVNQLSDNDFEPLVSSTHEEVRSSIEALSDAGGRSVLLSGSGAASFGFFDSSGEAASVAESLSGALGWPFIAAVTRSDLPLIVHS